MGHINLQLFAGEGAGAAGSGAGESAGTAVRAIEPAEAQRSARDYAERYGYRRPQRRAQAAQQPDDAARQEPREQTQQPQHVSFRDLIKGDEYKAEADEYIQGVIRDRLKSSKANEQMLASMSPIIARTAEKYGLDASDLGKLDYAALAAKMDEDTSGLEDEALEKGMSVETLANLKALERQNKELREREALSRREAEERETFADLARQAEELAKIVPGFNIAAEMQANSKFARMVMPPSMRGSGLSVEEAYFATHHNELMQAGMAAAQQRAQQQIVNSIRSGSRPVENGTRSAGAGAPPAMDPATLTPEQRRQIRERAKNGERIEF